MPFIDDLQRDTHFLRHGRRCGAATAHDYERMADEFMFGSIAGDARECVRPRGDRVRFGFVTEKFGVARQHPICVRTFYRVDVSVLLGRGGKEPFFAYECARVDL